MKLNERALRHAMLNADIETWKDFITATGIPRRSLYNIRNGTSSPSIDTCYSIKKALSLTRNQFFEIFQED